MRLIDRLLIDSQSDESCPKCGKQGLSYYTMQLRSADEGSTVFYEVRNLGPSQRLH